MSVTVIIPSAFQRFTANNHQLKMEAGNVEELLAGLSHKFPALKSRMFDEKNLPHRFINIYVNSDDIRFLQKEKTRLKSGDEVAIIPAIAGG